MTRFDRHFQIAKYGTLRTFRGRCFAASAVLLCGISAFAQEPVEGDDSYVESPLTTADRDHWSLKPVADDAVPVCEDSEWCRNEIDHFIAANLEQHGLVPQPEASRRVLIRRVTLDLTGLLPTLTEVDLFLADDSRDAFENLVDRLLGSSAYGEHWAQHWLDLARFAETDGFEHDKIRPDAWRYRDWVIDSLNRDVSYDNFVRLQIAGDLLKPDDPSAIIATQFCVSGPDMPDINSQDERRHTLLNELTATVGEVVLGLQIGCAQCHDHKYDPISQADFYRLRAIFEPAIHVKKDHSVTALREELLADSLSHLMVRGDFRRPGPAVVPGVPRVFESMGLESEGLVVKDSSQRPRAQLANWLVNPRHPLTARVLVNRIWQQHFGIGLCETSSDFGVMGQEPINGALLDWLAHWFVKNGWSLKKLHQMLVSSATYRQRSQLPETRSAGELADWHESLQIDSHARLLSRFPRQRLQGEVIRDVMLQVAGVLNRKSGGPGVCPPLPDELRNTLLKDQWKVTDDETEHDRRSIYVFSRRNLCFPIFEAFDRPSANESCSRRNVSTTASQSLHLLNSRFSFLISELLAKKILVTWPKPDQQVSAAFEAILGRKPTVDEQRAVDAFEKNSDGERQAVLTNLCLAFFNSNEFVFVD